VLRTHENVISVHTQSNFFSSAPKQARFQERHSESRFWPEEPHSVLRTHDDQVSMHTQSSFIHVASKRGDTVWFHSGKAFETAFKVRNRVSGLTNHIRCYERLKIMFRCVLGVVSYMLLQNVHGFQEKHSEELLM